MADRPNRQTLACGISLTSELNYRFKMSKMINFNSLNHQNHKVAEKVQQVQMRINSTNYVCLLYGCIGKHRISYPKESTTVYNEVILA